MSNSTEMRLGLRAWRWAAIAILGGAAACQQVSTTSNSSQPAAAAPAPAAPAAAPAAAAPQAGAKPAGPAAPTGPKPAAVAAAPAVPAPQVQARAEPEPAEPAAADRRVRIVNESGQVITLIKGSPSNVSDWGEDRIPTSVLAAGDAVMIDFDDGNGECVYDLQATLADGTVRVAPRANVCRIAEWTVTAEE